MTDDMKRVCAALDRNVWDGLQAYAQLRKDIREKEAIDANDWDAVNRAKGAHEEAKKIARLQAEFEAYVHERNTAMKK